MKILFLIFLVMGVSAKAVASTPCATIFKELLKINIPNIKVESILLNPKGGYDIQINKSGSQVAFIGSMSIPIFIQEFSYVSQRLGFQLLDFQVMHHRRYEANAKYVIPDIETLNKKLILLRQEGILSDNGLSFTYVEGNISKTEYIQYFLEGKIPLSFTDSHFFHDINSHMIGFILLPKDVTELLRKDLLALLPFTSASQSGADKVIGLREGLSTIIDKISAVSQQSSGLPRLEELYSDRMRDFRDTELILSGNAALKDTIELLKKEYEAINLKYGNKQYEVWLNSEIKRLKGLGLAI